MKFNSKPLLGLLVVWSLSGCQTQYPSSYLSSSGPNPAMIINFDSPWNSPQTVAALQPLSGPLTDVSGSPVTELKVNPILAEAGKLGNVVQSAGTIVPTGSPTLIPLFVGPGANNTPYCVHMAGTVTDPGNASYPAAMLAIPLELGGNGQYDASLFSGIKFFIKTSSADNVGTRSFQIPVVKTSVAPAGTCALYNSCYNNFFYTYPATNGNWQSVVIPFNTMTRQSYGGAISPTTLSGTNLQQILSLQWSEGNNNVPGTVTVDFYVDEVQFF